MDDPKIHTLPVLGFRKLSAYFADLLIAGAGEGAAMRQPNTRRAWHYFFFSCLVFFLWYLVTRICVAPSFEGNPTFILVIRTIEMLMYGYLIIVLSLLIYCHHRFMLIPRLSLRFRTLLFFLFMMVLLFSRVYYSLYHIDPNHFSFSEVAIHPTLHFGVHGTDDLYAVLEFILLSSSIILNSSYELIQPESLLANTIVIIESGVGFIFIAILVATFVEIISDRQRT